MARSGKSIASDQAAQSAVNLSTLIAALSSDDGWVRQHARETLATMGPAAVTPLVEALKHSPEQPVRWEAAKTLIELREPSAAPVLVNVLEDENSDIRWLVGEGLIALKRDAVAPLLEALIRRSDSVWLREGAHHVLHVVARGNLKDVLAPVVSALKDIEPALEVPPAAQAALDALTEKRRS